MVEEMARSLSPDFFIFFDIAFMIVLVWLRYDYFVNSRRFRHYAESSLIGLVIFEFAVYLIIIVTLLFGTLPGVPSSGSLEEMTLFVGAPIAFFYYLTLTLISTICFKPVR